LALAVAAILAGSAGSANAVHLVGGGTTLSTKPPAASGFVSINGGSDFFGAFDAYSVIPGGPLTLQASGDNAGGSGALVLGSDPSGLAAAQSLSGVGVQSQADLTYYFAVNGPSGASVPVDMIGALSTAASGFNANAEAVLELYDSTSGTQVYEALACAATSNVCNGVASSATVSETIDVTSGDAMQVFIQNNAQADYVGTATATVDPTFVIDPTYLEAHPGYTLTFGAGVISSAPEPRTWALMLVGLGGLGLALRGAGRRRYGAVQA